MAKKEFKDKTDLEVLNELLDNADHMAIEIKAEHKRLDSLYGAAVRQRAILKAQIKRIEEGMEKNGEED